MLGAIRPAVAQLFSSMSIHDDLHIVLIRPPIGTNVLCEVFFFALARGAPLLDATIGNLAIAWICGQAGPCSYGQHVLPNTTCSGNGLPAKNGYRHFFATALAMRVALLIQSIQGSSGLRCGPAMRLSIWFCVEVSKRFSLAVGNQDSLHHKAV